MSACTAFLARGSSQAMGCTFIVWSKHQRENRHLLLSVPLNEQNLRIRTEFAWGRYPAQQLYSIEHWMRETSAGSLETRKQW